MRGTGGALGTLAWSGTFGSSSEKVDCPCVMRAELATLPSSFHQVHLPISTPFTNSPVTDFCPFSCHQIHWPLRSPLTYWPSIAFWPFSNHQFDLPIGKSFRYCPSSSFWPFLCQVTYLPCR